MIGGSLAAIDDPPGGREHGWSSMAVRVIHTTVLTSARAADVITAMSMWAGREILLHIV
jgi:hypothetical protein